MMNTKDYCKRLVAAFIALCMSAVYAGVSVKWIAETSRVQPEIIDAWRGDTLDLACTLRSYGQPVTNGAATASFMWQTNGMGSAWWQTNAVVTTAGVVRATWSPSMDPGAGEVAFFMPVVDADGASYRAAGRIRFRPSPGAGAEFVDLPAPGATLDFGAYTLVNAPWATLEAVNSAIDANNAIIDSAISSATGALVIPPAVDLGPYTTTNMVFAAVQTSSNGLANAIQVAFTAASNRTDAVAADLAAEISSTSNGLRSVLRDTIAESTTASRAYSDAVASNAQRAATAAIPSLAGYATQSWTANYFATNYTPPDLSSYASRSYADAAASNAQRAAIAAIPSLTGYATQSWTADYFATNYTPPDLSSYASRAYADSAAASAQAAAIAAIPSLNGYATESWTAQFFATNYTPPNLSAYATRAYADSAASNAQAAAIAAIPSLNGYATESWTASYFSTNYTPPDLSSYASRAYADAAASNAQATAMAAIPSLSGYATETYAQSTAQAAASGVLASAQDFALGLSWATSVGNTRLVSVDGTIWQDATGTVWQVSVTSYGWVGTVVNIATATASPVVFNYVPAVLGVSDEYYTDGTGNELHFEEGMSDTWLLSTNQVGTVFSPLEDPPPGRDATNLTYNTGVELFSLIYRPVALATNVIDHVLYESTGGGEPGNYAVVSNAAMSAAAQTNDFLRLTGGSMQGPICFPYFDDYGVRISPFHPGALVFDSTYPNYSGLSALLDLTRIPTDANGYGFEEIAFLSDLELCVPTNALAGKTYDFQSNVGLYTAVRDLITALGGSVTNFPAIPQGGN